MSRDSSPDLRSRMQTELRSATQSFQGSPAAPGASVNQPGVSTESGVTNGTGAEGLTPEQKQKAVRSGAGAAFGAALALILGAGAAGVGGLVGKRRFLNIVPERKELLMTSRY